jgi:para-nitrobenzyl esterase
MSTVTSWRGIRFAEVAHSFAAAVPVELTERPAPGGSFGPAPLQTPIPGVDLGAPTSADCLNLNVWAPSDAEGLPVAVWVFGGGFEMGAASVSWYDPAALAADAGCVVVALNYRVGAFGFAQLSSHGGALEAAHNQGLHDVRVAVEWIRAHISLFGGDPEQLTVLGSSAGGFLTCALATTPDAPPIRAIGCFSGGASRIIAREDAEAFADAILADLGITDTPESLLELAPEDILAAQRRVAPTSLAVRNGLHPQGFGVALDDTAASPLVPRHPMDAVADGALRDTFVLAASAVDEMDGFPAASVGAPDDLATAVAELTGDLPAGLIADYADAAAGTSTAWRRILADYIYRLPAARLVDAQRAAGGGAALLEISREPGAPAVHGSDTTGIFGGGAAARDEVVHAAVIELIRTGRVDGGSVEDPLYAGERAPSGVLSPAELLTAWSGVRRP